ncbi:fused signal recognition particle receptor [Aeromonas sp. BIGb0405]|nr:fused signal recognition particle receptor [Aeromonas sp. BIGb0405]
MFSWLGFGRKKEEAEVVQPQTPQSETVSTQDGASATSSPSTDVISAESGETSLPHADPLLDPLAEDLNTAPLVIEECASSLEPVIVNPELLSPEEDAAKVAAEQEAARIAAEQEAARVAAEQEAARIGAEQEVARVAAEQEVARVAAEQEAARVAAEQEAARVAAEQEVARVAAEQEAARVAAEQEAARIGAEQEAARIAAEQEAARIAAEQEAARVAAEQEAARVAAEQEAARVAAEQEVARIAAEQEAARVAAEQEAARVAAEQEAARVVAEQEVARIAAEQEAARVAAEQEAAALAALPLAADVADDTQAKPQREGFFARLKRSLVRTRENIGSGFFSLFSGKQIDDELFEELETQLLTADLGVDTTTRIINSLTQHASRKQLKDGEALYGLLKQDMGEMLAKVEQPLVIDTSKKPYVILMVGVNGVGKTTTIGKLAKQLQAEGKSVMLAAGDTFRAAAVEQLQVWGQRNNLPVIAQHTGADSASVIYDAIEAARSRGADVLIADTAGRLQNKSNLMEELKKVVRVMKKLDEEAPHEIMLTLDAGTGQNALSQAKLFKEAVGLTGITLTKLDGTAKGGVIFAVADKFQIPIRFIGVGEGIDDLRPFVANDFIEALFSRDE